MTDCKHTETKVVDYLDAALSAVDRAKFEQHIASCGACGAMVRSYRAIQDVYRDIPDEDVSDSMSRSILTVARETQAPPASHALLRFPVVLAAAIAVLFVWIGSHLFSSRPAVETESRPALVEFTRQGEAHRTAGRLEQAIASYEHALTLAEDGVRRAELLHRAGALYLELERPELALERLEDLTRHHPNYDERSSGLLLLGEALEGIGEVGRALQAYRRVAQEFPDASVEAQRRMEHLEFVEETEFEALRALGYVE